MTKAAMTNIPSNDNAGAPVKLALKLSLTWMRLKDDVQLT